jgi:putative acetyltransferase
MAMIRHEKPDDVPTIRRVHEAAFPTPAEARLVDSLRVGGHLALSLVCERDGNVVGHIAISPVTFADQRVNGLGLAPVAVLPDYQRQGIGGALINEGLTMCRARGVGFVAVLGEPAYYRRFGFAAAGPKGLGNEYGADEEFMVMELQPGALPAGRGLVRYGPEFATFAG